MPGPRLYPTTTLCLSCAVNVSLTNKKRTFFVSNYMPQQAKYNEHFSWLRLYFKTLGRGQGLKARTQRQGQHKKAREELGY